MKEQKYVEYYPTFGLDDEPDEKRFVARVPVPDDKPSDETKNNEDK